jgi:hypothetical protein
MWDAVALLWVAYASAGLPRRDSVTPRIDRGEAGELESFRTYKTETIAKLGWTFQF